MMKARTALRFLRRLRDRLRPRRRYLLKPQPMRGIAREGAGFRSLDDDPQFDLVPREGWGLPRNRCRLSFTLKAVEGDLRPVLYWDQGQGFEVGARTPLPLTATRQSITLPSSLKALRLDPMEGPGLFELGDIEVEEEPADRGAVLFFEDRIPDPGLGAGYPRAAEMIAGLRSRGFSVSLYPIDGGSETWPDPGRDLPEEVEVLHAWGRERLRDFCEHRLDAFAAVLVSRPHNMALLWATIEERRELLGGARLIYDAEALYARRTIAQRSLEGRSLSQDEAAALIHEELALAGPADRVLCVSPQEQALFANNGARAAVLSHACLPRPMSGSFDEREGFLFVGALSDPASPNVDSLRWFLQAVWPRVRAELPGARLLVAGGGGAETVDPEPGVEILGFVEDLEPVYAQARVFVAPTRFAAGIPLKIIEAAAWGLPAVASAFLAEQLGWETEVEAASVEPAAFAEACLALHRDAELWHRRRAAALARVARDHGAAAFAEVLDRAVTGA